MQERPPSPHEALTDPQWQNLEEVGSRLFSQIEQRLTEAAFHHFFPRDSLLQTLLTRWHALTCSFQKEIWINTIRAYLAESYPLDSPADSLQRLFHLTGPNRTTSPLLQRPSPPGVLATLAPSLRPASPSIARNARDLLAMVLQQFFTSPEIAHPNFQAKVMERLKASLETTVDHATKGEPSAHSPLSGTVVQEKIPRPLAAALDPKHLRASIAILVREHLSALLGRALSEASQKALERYITFKKHLYDKSVSRRAVPPPEERFATIYTQEDQKLLNQYFVEVLIELLGSSPQRIRVPPPAGHSV